MDRVGKKEGAEEPTHRGSHPGRPPAERDWGDDWVHELITMTRPGVEIQFPARQVDDREIPFVYDDFR